MSFWQIKMKGAKHADVMIYSVIGESMWGEETVDAKTFVREITALAVDTISLRINSPGGSVFDGTAIYNALERHPARITAYIDGVAASMASVIPLVADKIVMAPNAYMMIHNPSLFASGTAEDLRSAAKMLDKIETVMVGVYAKRTGQDAASIRAAMAAETWYTADEAIAFGLADATGDEVKDVSALAHFDARALAKFEHPPARLVAAFAGGDAPKIGAPSGTPSSNEGDTMNPALAAIRDALEMPATATESEVRAAALAAAQDDTTTTTTTTTETPAEGDDPLKDADGNPLPATPAPDEEIVPAEPTTLPADGKPDASLVDNAVLARLTADAKAGREARNQQVTEAREGIVAKAISEGRIDRSQSKAYLAQLAQGGTIEASARDLLTKPAAEGGLTPGLVPVDGELGSSVDVEASGTDGGSAYDEGLFPEVVAKKAALALAGGTVHPLIAREG